MQCKLLFKDIVIVLNRARKTRVIEHKLNGLIEAWFGNHSFACGIHKAVLSIRYFLVQETYWLAQVRNDG